MIRLISLALTREGRHRPRHLFFRVKWKKVLHSATIIGTPILPSMTATVKHIVFFSFFVGIKITDNLGSILCQWFHKVIPMRSSDVSKYIFVNNFDQAEIRHTMIVNVFVRSRTIGWCTDAWHDPHRLKVDVDLRSTLNLTFWYYVCHAMHFDKKKRWNTYLFSSSVKYKVMRKELVSWETAPFSFHNPWNSAFAYFLCFGFFAGRSGGGGQGGNAQAFQNWKS